MFHMISSPTQPWGSKTQLLKFVHRLLGIGDDGQQIQLL